jgi:hypothetical protein
MMNGLRPTRRTGAKSFTGSYGSVLKVCTFVTMAAVVA